MSDKISEIRARHEEGSRAGADADRAYLLAEVERLREVLRWYASERNHFPLVLHYCGPGELDPAAFFLQEPPVMGDGGKRAREALEAKP